MRDMLFKVCFLIGICGLGFNLTEAQPIADFEANIIQGCAPLSLTLQDKSTGATSWEWTINNSVSFQQNPFIVLVNPGTYDITLVVTGQTGLKDTLHKPAYITVADHPTVDFVADKTEGCINESFSFTDLSTANSGSISSWKWSFGDGHVSNDPNPTISYPVVGDFNVTLSVTNSFGCQETKTINSYIDILAPNAEFTGINIYSCEFPLESTFFPEASAGLDHFWDFGDGNTSTDPVPTHTFTSSGTYDISHTVTDQLGCSQVEVKDDYVFIGNNSIEIVLSDTGFCFNDLITFSTEAPAGSTIYWDLGDGTNSSDNSVSHTYATTDTFKVSLSVTEPNGCFTFLEEDIIVNPYPEPDFNISDISSGCNLPRFVTFEDQSQGAVNWYWIFGDGKTSTEQHPETYYTQTGEFTVILAARGPGGCLKTEVKSDYLHIQPPEANFASNAVNGCAPKDIVFTSLSIAANPIVSYLWDMGDGTTYTTADPTHTFANPGSYTVSLTITDSEGCQSTFVQPNYIEVGYQPTVDFEADTLTSCAHTDIQFTDLSSHGDEFIWRFGDGAVSTEQHPKHSFIEEGLTDVTLEVYDRGCKSDTTKMGFVDILGPALSFIIDQNRFCELPAEINITNESMAYDTFEWQFGDTNGSTSQDLSPTFTYTEEGAFVVHLEATNFTNGCTVSIKDSIRIETITSDFRSNRSEGCVPLGVYFYDQSINAISWEWDFNNGESKSEQFPGGAFFHHGMYDVSLITSNSLGCKDTLNKTEFINAYGVLVNFDVDDSTLCNRQEVQFINNTTSFENVSSWKWDFGDGNTSDQFNPTHQYNEAGIYTVKLWAMNENGCIDSLIKSDFIYHQLPKAEFDVPYPENCVNNPVEFVLDTVVTSSTYTWLTGKGDTLTGPNPTCTYDSLGTYSVGLMYTDSIGCSDTLILDNLIEIREFNLDFTSDTATALCPPLAVSFPLLTNCEDSASYLWTFGDGNIATGCNGTNTYTAAGTYDVSVIINHFSGCTDTAQKTNFISIGGPIASIDISPLSVCRFENISFSATTDPSNTTEWVFGDGVTSPGPNTTYAYADKGIYYPVLITTDTVGCQSFLPSQEPISIQPPPNPQIVRGDSVVCLFEVVELGISGLSNIEDSYTWVWEIGDGSSYNGDSVSHQFNTIGTYDLRLISTNQLGCIDTTFFPDFFWVKSPPSTHVVFDSPSGCLPFSQTYELIDPNDSTFAPASVIWDWGDGSSTSTGQYQTHTYTNPGTYKLQIYVEDQFGCEANDEIYITTHASQSVDFEADKTVGCAPFEVNFSDLSQDGQEWLWYFGDGDSSNLSQPVHTYQSPGSYTVSLEVTNQEGCKSTVVKADYILVPSSTLHASISDTAICLGNSIDLYDLSIVQDSIIEQLWDLGNGDTLSGSQVSYSYSQGGTYNIQLYITTANGCINALDQPLSVNVTESSISSLGLNDTAGCAPFQLNAIPQIQTSQEIQTWEWNSGDGSQGNQDEFIHVYELPGVYEVSLFTETSEGCSDITRQNIIVHEKPIASFSISDTIGCAPFATSFEALDSSATRWAWDFGDGASDTLKVSQHNFMQNGIYFPKLTVWNEHGCQDTSTGNPSISLGLPLIDFAMDKETACPGDSFEFTLVNPNSRPIASASWDFGDGSMGIGESVTHAYSEGGIYFISLVIEDIYGCRDTLEAHKMVEVHSSSTPEPIDLIITEITGHQQIDLTFHSSTLPITEFDYYQLFRKSDVQTNWSEIAQLNDINDTSYTDLNVFTDSIKYCYAILNKSVCGVLPSVDDAEVHCPIMLTTAPEEGAIRLNWNAYEGVEAQSYLIYRTDAYSMSNSSLIGVVDSSTLEFRDSLASCELEYGYRIQMRGKNMERSFSNISFSSSIHTPLAAEKSILTAGVENNEFIKVEWEKTDSSSSYQFALERNAGTGFKQIQTFPDNLQAYKFQDKQVNVHQQSYSYRVMKIDSCGVESPATETAHTVFLTSQSITGGIKLNWTPYIGWPDGVDYYRIETYDESLRVYDHVADVPGTESSYEDTDLNTAQNRLPCYRITAFERNGTDKASLSNEVCAEPTAQIFTPNAFSPNGDGINDKFEIKSAFVENFRLNIYNRWGLKVFYSDNAGSCWEGHLPNGSLAPGGVYVYQIEAFSLEGKQIKLQGSVMLIR